MNRAIIFTAAVCLVGGPIAASVTSTQVIAAETQKAGVLSQAAAIEFSKQRGMTLSQALDAGLLKPAQVPGTYVVTDEGARAAGVAVPPGGKLTPLQITALVAGVLGLTLVTIDFIDDDDDGGFPPTPTPTQTPPGPPTTTTTGTQPGTGTNTGSATK
ncbi:MAG: hypothetical protein ACLGI7_17590 [Gammaproteobacteria bacterium]